MHSHLSQVGGVYTVLKERAQGYTTPKSLQRHLQFPDTFALQLDVKDVLQGHAGCVNRLAWNQEGTMLASGSDDRSVALWHYPESSRPPIHFLTQHQSNIFGVAFLPFHNNTHIITGAMDGLVQLHRLDADPSLSRDNDWMALPQRRQRAESFTGVLTEEVFCHKNRIKAVDVDPTDANLFWSGSEDGTVQQFDVRCPPRTWETNSNLLIQLRQQAHQLDVLSIRINKAKPWQMGVAAADQFVRIFDRRKLSVGAMQDANVSTKEILKLAPPHLCTQPPRSSHRANPTYVDFGRNGDKVVASYHAEHAYSFRVDRAAVDAQARAFKQPPPRNQSAAESAEGQPFATCLGRLPPIRQINILHERSGSQDLHPGADAAKKEGNQAFFDHDDNAAVWHYTKAIHLAPDSGVLYIMRAAAFLKRDWMGDNFAALADCECAIRLDPTLVKAYCRRVVALISLGQLQAAERALRAFEVYFPASKEPRDRLQASLAREKTAKNARQEQFHASPHTEDASTRPAGGDVPRRSLEESDVDDLREAANDSLDEGSGSAQDSMQSSQSAGEPMDFTPHFDEWPRGEESDAEKMEDLLDEEDRLSWRMAAESYSFQQRYVGHRNVQTDIKEACFMGGNDDLVAAGSDDGQVFIYNVETGYPIKCLQADEDVVNCVQPHPSLPVLATSGIENVVRLWQPENPRESSKVQNIMQTIRDNQQKLKHHSCLYGRVTPGMLAALSQNHHFLNVLMALEFQNTANNPAGPPAAANNQTPAPEPPCRLM